MLLAVASNGYTIPTPIQSAAIPVALTGRDVLGIAQTGTGKTASFVLPMLTRLERGRARARMPRSLILAPTRELAAQSAEHFGNFGKEHKLTVALLIGGVSFEDQDRKLDRGADVVIATPGRLLDHFQRGKLLMTAIEILVIDEADRMLDMGFIPDIERICSMLPPTRQTLFFSATMPPEIQRLVSQFLRDPERIEVAPPATAAQTITQRFLRAPSDPKDKRAVLRELIRTQKIKNAIIFCNRKRDVAILHRSLVRHGFNAGALHGDMDQHQRTATLDSFRSGQIAILAASDVAARGLDIPEVSHVFNYDVPVHAEDYVHRIGRTGRAGREGFSATLVTSMDAKMMRAIEKMVGAPIEWLADVKADAGSEGSAGVSEADAGRGASERSRDRGRGGRDRRDVSDRKPKAEAEAETSAAPQSAARPHREPRPERGPRPQAPGSGPQPRTPQVTEKPTDKPAADRPQPPRGRERHADRPRSPDPQPGDRRPPQTARRSESRDSRGYERHHRGEDTMSPVLGMGDHVPEFMKRPVKIAGE